jgi:hypothetical protein
MPVAFAFSYTTVNPSGSRLQLQAWNGVWSCANVSYLRPPMTVVQLDSVASAIFLDSNTCMEPLGLRARLLGHDEDCINITML